MVAMKSEIQILKDLLTHAHRTWKVNPFAMIVYKSSLFLYILASCYDKFSLGSNMSKNLLYYTWQVVLYKMQEVY